MALPITTQKATAFMDRAIGLIGKVPSHPFFFQTRWGIHTFFVPAPIDVVIMDDLFRVRITKESLQPNKIFLWNPQFRNVLELPAGTIKEKKISIGIDIVIL